MNVSTTSWSKPLDEITLSRTAAALPGFSFNGQACRLQAQMNKSLQRTRRSSLVGKADVTGGVPLNSIR